MQAETTRTRFRRSCGFSWDRSVIATAPHSQQLLGPHFMDGRHPGRPELKPQFRPSLFGLQHRCCTVRGPVLHLRVPYFRPTFTAGELSGQLRRPYFGLCAALQALSIAFVASRHACFGLTIVQMHGPSPPGWAGCLDDLILDTLVFHAGNNRSRAQRFLSGFGQNRPLLRSGYPRHLAHVSWGQTRPSDRNRARSVRATWASKRTRRPAKAKGK